MGWDVSAHYHIQVMGSIGWLGYRWDDLLPCSMPLIKQPLLSSYYFVIHTCCYDHHYKSGALSKILQLIKILSAHSGLGQVFKGFICRYNVWQLTESSDVLMTFYWSSRNNNLTGTWQKTD